MNHPTWSLELETGCLVLMPCPGTQRVSVQATLQQLKAQGVCGIVCALDDTELAAAKVSELKQEVIRCGMLWWQLAIEDDKAPGTEFVQQWRKVSKQLHAELAAGRTLALHCMGGSGRTGLLAGHLLLERQWPIERVISEVQSLRPGAFTKPVQRQYITQLAQQLHA